MAKTRISVNGVGIVVYQGRNRVAQGLTMEEAIRLEARLNGHTHALQQRAPADRGWGPWKTIAVGSEEGITRRWGGRILDQRVIALPC